MRISPPLPRRPRAPARRTRPSLEGLEERALLTISISPVTIATSPNSWPPVAAGTFTDSNPSLTDTDFQVTFAWSDGTTTSGYIYDIPGKPGTFSVWAQKSFPGLGTYTATETIAARGGTDSATAQVATRVTINPTLTVDPIPPTMANVPVSVRVDDPDPGLSGLTATIDWGDGTTSPAVITTNPADPVWTYSSLTIASPGAGHVYANPGRYKVTVDLLGPDGSVLSSGQQGVTITPDQPVLSVLSGYGQPGTPLFGPGLLASFSDIGGPADAPDYTATIDWSDGTTSQGTVVAAQGVPGLTLSEPFEVNGSHAYAADGTYTVTVTVTPDDGSAPFSATARATVGSAPPPVIGPIIVTEPIAFPAPTLVPFPSIAATATAPTSPALADFIGPTGSYAAEMDWGDGSAPTYGQVVPVVTSGGETTYTIVGSHDYLKAGTYTITLDLNGPDGLSSPVTTKAVVAAGKMIAMPDGPALAAMQGRAIDATLATFTYSGNLSAPLATSGLIANVDWGDGSAPEAATIVHEPTPALVGAPPEFGVDASHVYRTPGSDSPIINIVAPDGESWWLKDYVAVAADPNGPTNLKADGTYMATQGSPSTTHVNLATFDAPAGTYAAAIAWGDGTASPAAVLPDGATPGQYDIAASHIYARAGTYQAAIAVITAGGEVDWVTRTITVAPPPGAATGIQGQPATGRAGALVTSPLVTFRGGVAAGEDYVAAIEWGDGTSSFAFATPLVSVVQIISPTRPNYEIAGVHAYAAAGSYTIRVNIVAPDGESTWATTTATIGPASAPTLVAPQPVAGVAGRPLSGATLALYEVPAGLAGADVAAVDWGDGSAASLARVVPSTAGTRAVVGSHTYARPGLYAITIDVVRPDGTSYTMPSWASIA